MIKVREIKKLEKFRVSVKHKRSEYMVIIATDGVTYEIRKIFKNKKLLKTVSIKKVFEMKKSDFIEKTIKPLKESEFQKEMDKYFKKLREKESKETKKDNPYGDMPF